MWKGKNALLKHSINEFLQMKESGIAIDSDGVLGARCIPGGMLFRITNVL